MPRKENDVLRSEVEGATNQLASELSDVLFESVTELDYDDKTQVSILVDVLSRLTVTTLSALNPDLSLKETVIPKYVDLLLTAADVVSGLRKTRAH